MIQAGMDVARINFSHGNYEEHLKNIQMIRQVSQRVRRQVAILQDLPGPKIRVGKLPVEPFHLRKFDRVVLTTKPTTAKTKIPVPYPDLPKAVKKSDMIYLADGSIQIEVTRSKKEEVEGRVLVGGELVSGKGVNLPRLRIRVSAITKEDREHLKFGLENDIDIVAVSFVQDADDVKSARDIAAGKGRSPFIVAKIEKREAVTNLENVVKEADGVMVARGDLGVELNLELVPVIQKKIIHEANRYGKPVITATQMLESMLSSPTPTRAEATDVANAIIDGSDALMLAEETAVGKYPVQAVQVLSTVAHETEKYLPKQISEQRKLWYENAADDAIALAACETSLEVGASAIVSRTRTGKTARLVAKYRPPLPILALTPNQKVLKQLLLSWGVKPVLADHVTMLEDVFRGAEKTAKSLRLARKGDKIAIVCGDPEAPAGHTEILKIQSVK
jgi:pyruvate kinase